MNFFAKLIEDAGYEDASLYMHYARRLDAICVQKYGDVKYNAFWRHIYCVGNYEVSFMLPDGNLEPHLIEAVPCHNCGLIVPYVGATIHVDHYIPQSRLEVKIIGKKNPVIIPDNWEFFILKAFRAVGLADDTGGPSGKKGLMIRMYIDNPNNDLSLLTRTLQGTLDSWTLPQQLRKEMNSYIDASPILAILEAINKLTGTLTQYPVNIPEQLEFLGELKYKDAIQTMIYRLRHQVPRQLNQLRRPDMNAMLEYKFEQHKDLIGMQQGVLGVSDGDLLALEAEEKRYSDIEFFFNMLNIFQHDMPTDFFDRITMQALLLLLELWRKMNQANFKFLLIALDILCRFGQEAQLHRLLQGLLNLKEPQRVYVLTGFYLLREDADTIQKVLNNSHGKSLQEALKEVVQEVVQETKDVQPPNQNDAELAFRLASVKQLFPNGNLFGQPGIKPGDYSVNPCKYMFGDNGWDFIATLLSSTATTVAEIAEKCMNSLVNLVPLCPACNIKKSDS